MCMHTQRNNSTVQWNSCKGICFWLGWLVGWICRRNYYGRYTTMELDRTINIEEWEKSELIETQAVIRAYTVVVQCQPVSPWIQSWRPLWSAPDKCPALLYMSCSGAKMVLPQIKVCQDSKLFLPISEESKASLKSTSKSTPNRHWFLFWTALILNININMFSSVSQHFCFRR